MLFGCDISEHNGNINANKIISRYDFAIIRAGYGKYQNQKDAYFEKNYKKLHGKIPLGVYWYSYANSEQEILQEMVLFLSIIKGKSFEYPIFIDIEEKRTFNVGKDKLQKMVISALDYLEKAGCFSGIYMSRYYIDNYLNKKITDRFCTWCADYTSRKYSINDGFGIRQFSGGSWTDCCQSKRIDENTSFIDYKKIIKNKFNKF